MIIADMTNEMYHGSAAIGSSDLKLVQRTPLHYWAAKLDPSRPERAQTKAMKIGTMIHTATLEPHLFDEMFTVMPEGLDRRTKEGKETWALIQATGKEPVTQGELDTAKGAAASIHAHPTTRLLFDRCGAVTEQSIFWNDPHTGLPMKVRPDIMVAPCELFPNGLIADVKSTEDAGEEAFGKSAWNWDMHLQAALYPEGFMAAHGTSEPPAFFWLAVEKARPYACRYFACTSALSEYGMIEVNKLRGKLAQAFATGQWPGYPTRATEINLPTYAERVVTDAIQN